MLKDLESKAAALDPGESRLSMEKTIKIFREYLDQMRSLEERHANMIEIEKGLDAIRVEIIKPVRAELEKASYVGLWLGGAGLIASILSLIYGMWTTRPARPSGPDQDTTAGLSAFAPPDTAQFILGNNVGGIALSPDGKLISFVAWKNRKSGLWVRAVNSAAGAIVGKAPDDPLSNTEGAAYPFWSPDGKSVAFFADGQLRRLDLATEEQKRICSVAIGRGGTWTDDDKIVFGSVMSGLNTVPASGGHPTVLTELDIKGKETAHSWPQMLPGGRFLYWVRSDIDENQGVYAASLANPRDRKRVLATDTNAVYAHSAGGDHLLWLNRDGDLLVQQFDISTLNLNGVAKQIASGVARIRLFGRANLAIPAKGTLLYAAFNTPSQFTLFERDGKPVQKSGQADQYTTFRISPDGRHIAASVDKSGGTTLMADIRDPDFFPVISDPGMNSYPVWSPDGHAILYTSSRLNLFLRDVRGTGRSESLTRSANAQYATDWSQDGKSVLYWEVSPPNAKREFGRRDLWILPMTSANKPAGEPRPYMQTKDNESWGRFSPELTPRWIAYQSDAASGKNDVYVETFPKPSGSPIQISRNGGQYPEWNQNGRELFYVSQDYKLMAVTLKHGLISIGPSDLSSPRELFSLPAVDIGWPPYDVEPQTQRILVRATPDQAPKPLTLVFNWPALLQN